jgi:uncharacterized repeat protein (TIGR01451 family)
MNKYTSRSTALAISNTEVGIMKNAKSTMLKLFFGALVISSFAACNQIPEPVVLDFEDTVIASDGSSQKIPGVVPDGEVGVLLPGEIAPVKWGFPTGFPTACNTSANIVKNPKFMLGIVNGGPGNNLQTVGTAQAANWTSAYGTPQLSPITLLSAPHPVMGHGNPGYVQMWGYGSGGEAVKQIGVPFMAYSSYDVYFSAQQFSTANPTQLHALFMASSSSSAMPYPWTYSAAINVPIIGPVVNYPTTSWKKYGPYNLITGSIAPDTITLASSNLSPVPSFNPSTFSWGQYDNICILPKQPTEKADISITKELKDPAIAGQPNTYVLNVNNAGPGAGGSPVKVTDILPPGVTYNPTITFPAGWSCNTSSLPTITCTIPSMPVGNAQIYIPVTFNPGQVGPVKNCAGVSAPNDTTPQNNESCITSDVQPHHEKFDLEIKKELKTKPAVSGQPNYYILNVTNLGPGSSSAPINIVDTLPSGVALNPNISAVTALPASAGFTCTGLITCSSSTSMAAGSSVQILIPVIVTQKDGILENCATVSALGDVNPQNDRSCVATDVVPATPKPFNLGIKKELSSDPATGSQFYTLTVTNFGPGVSSTPVNIIDNLPIGVTLGGTVTTSPLSAGFNCTGTVSCSSSTPMPVGSSVVITIPVLLNFNGGTDIVNCASVSAVGDTNPKDDRSCVTTVAPVRPFDLEIKKELGNIPGTIFQAYTLTITNLGAGSSSTPINISDVLPAGVTLNGTVTSSLANFNCTGTSTITCTSNTAMPAGSSVVITIPVTISSTGSDIVNCADVTAPNDINPQNNHSCVTTK